MGRDRRGSDFHSAEDVGVGVVDRVGDAVPHVDLCGEMEHNFGSKCLEQRADFVVPDVENFDVDVCGCERGVEVAHPAAAQVVDDEYLVTVLAQAIHKRRADESCSSGYRRAHRFAFPYF